MPIVGTNIVRNKKMKDKKKKYEVDFSDGIFRKNRISTGINWIVVVIVCYLLIFFKEIPRTVYISEDG